VAAGLARARQAALLRILASEREVATAALAARVPVPPRRAALLAQRGLVVLEARGRLATRSRTTAGPSS
jgi:hypothetical protein